MPYTIEDIEALTKKLAIERGTLSERVTTLHEELTTIKNRKLPGIKSAVVAAKEAEAVLKTAIEASRALFDEPRTIIVHGLKVGINKGRGRIEWSDEKTLLARIKKHFPDQAAVLIKTVESVRKKAIGALSTAELRTLGCTVTAAGEYVYVAPVGDEVDKLVTALLKPDASDESED